MGPKVLFGGLAAMLPHCIGQYMYGTPLFETAQIPTVSVCIYVCACVHVCICVGEDVLCAYTCMCTCLCVYVCGMTVMSLVYVAKAVCIIQLSVISSWTFPPCGVALIGVNLVSIKEMVQE